MDANGTGNDFDHCFGDVEECHEITCDITPRMCWNDELTYGLGFIRRKLSEIEHAEPPMNYDEYRLCLDRICRWANHLMYTHNPAEEKSADDREDYIALREKLQIVLGILSRVQYQVLHDKLKSERKERKVNKKESEVR